MKASIPRATELLASPSRTAGATPHSELGGQTPCDFECTGDYECPSMKICCSNDYGRVCVTPDFSAESYIHLKLIGVKETTGKSVV